MIKVLFMLTFLGVTSFISAQGIEGSESGDSILKTPEFYENFGGDFSLIGPEGKTISSVHAYVFPDSNRKSR